MKTRLNINHQFILIIVVRIKRGVGIAFNIPPQLKIHCRLSNWGYTSEHIN